MASDKISVKAKAIAAHRLKIPVEDVRFADGIFSGSRTNETITIGEVAKTAADPGKCPKAWSPA